jgi:hypothetical protein
MAKQTKKQATKPKPTAKKTAAKKPVAKKTAAKKPTAKKTTAKAAPKNAIAAMNKQLSALTRRPPNNPELPADYIQSIYAGLIYMKSVLEEHAAHLRSLDRKRLNGVGIKKTGFIERALALATEDPEFLPHYLTLEKFQEDNVYFTSVNSLLDLTRQIEELFLNIAIEAADVLYTDALEFYASVREAAKRRVDPAETINAELAKFFKRGSMRGGKEPTEKQIKRDVNALLSGKKDGKLIIKNVKPKISGGKRTVIDETFKDDIQFKETDEADIEA